MDCNADVYYQEEIAHLYLWNISQFYVFMFGWLKSAQLVLEHSGWGLWWRHATNGWFEVEPLRTAGTQQQYGIQREIAWGMGG